MREYFDLDKQVMHLVIHKSMMVSHSEIDELEVMLRDNNYRNLVSCSKIKLAELIGDYMIMYKTAAFRDWKEYFEMDCRVSKHLMGNLIDFERTINSRVSHHISDLMANDGFSISERNAIIQVIRTSQKRRLGLKPNQRLRNAYDGSRTWEFVAKMTFGEMKQLLFWLHDNKSEIYLEIIKEHSFLKNPNNSKKRIDELNRFRNNLFHFRPLNVYITHGDQRRGRYRVLNNKFRKDAVKFILRLNQNKAISFEVDEIVLNSDNYIK